MLNVMERNGTISFHYIQHLYWLNVVYTHARSPGSVSFELFLALRGWGIAGLKKSFGWGGSKWPAGWGLEIPELEGLTPHNAAFCVLHSFK